MRPSFHYALYKAFHAQKNHIRPEMTELGLSTGQPKVLECLTKNGGLMQREIADACEIEPATVSRILNNMEEADLVRRNASPDSNRAFSISLTEKGCVMQEKWMTLCSRVEERALAGFSVEEREQMISLLGRIYNNLSGKQMD